MTFSEFMLQNGYETKTTFWIDFTIADEFGTKAVKDTYKRAFEEWHGNVEYVTELVIVLNHKIWQHYENGNKQYAALYDELWRECDNWCIDNLKGEDLTYYYETTD